MIVFGLDSPQKSGMSEPFYWMENRAHLAARVLQQPVVGGSRVKSPDSVEARRRAEGWDSVVGAEDLRVECRREQSKTNFTIKDKLANLYEKSILDELSIFDSV